MDIGRKIAEKRKQLNLTQEQLAERLNVTPQAVSNWETGKNRPDFGIYPDLSAELQIPLADLVSDNGSVVRDWNLSFEFHDLSHMYTYVTGMAAALDMYQTLKVLPMAREWHEGAYRKTIGAKVKYFSHPLTLACHALSLGIREDNIICAALLHDVLEDCVNENGEPLTAADLPVNEETRTAVLALTRKKHGPHGEKPDGDDVNARYYEGIRQNRIACLVKVLDRCNNVSTMALGFPREKIAEYVVETETFVIPLIDHMKHTWPEFRTAAYLTKYQIRSVLETVKRLI